MLTLLLYGVLAIVVGVVLFLVVANVLPAGEQIAPPLRDDPPWLLPAERRLVPAEIDAIRLPVAVRGYRFTETDLLLDRLGEELRERDAEIARLRGEQPSFGSGTSREASHDLPGAVALQETASEPWIVAPVELPFDLPWTATPAEELSEPAAEPAEDRTMAESPEPPEPPTAELPEPAEAPVQVERTRRTRRGR